MELLETSSPTHIILGGVTTETGGEFKCEVSEGPPRFSTAARSTNLQVVGNKTFPKVLIFVKICKPTQIFPTQDLPSMV